VVFIDYPAKPYISRLVFDFLARDFKQLVNLFIVYLESFFYNIYDARFFTITKIIITIGHLNQQGTGSDLQSTAIIIRRFLVIKR
jgi:hypothetical protein